MSLYLADVEKTCLKLPEVSSPDLRRLTWRMALQIAATPGSLPYKYRGRQKFASEESALQTRAAETIGKISHLNYASCYQRLMDSKEKSLQPVSWILLRFTGVE